MKYLSHSTQVLCSPLASLMLFCLVLGLPAAENWPQFRGPRGAGCANGAAPPIRWSETDNIRWKTPIHGKGWSSPVIWDDQIWLTTATPDGHALFAVCVERSSGEILHDLKVFDIAKPDFCHPFNSYASPTPAVEAGRVYVHFGSAGTACLDSHRGKVIWARQDLPCDHYRGPGSSPILFNDLLIVQFDGVDQQYIVALDKHSGKTVWKRNRDIDYQTDVGDLKKAYATPTIIEVGGQAQIISPAAAATFAYDPPTGRELWRVRHGGMNVAAPPQFGQGKLFLCTGDGGLGLLAVRPDGHGDVTATNIDWTYRKGPTRCSPLLIGGRLYMLNERGLVSCLEAAIGRPVWQVRLDGAFSAAPIYAGGSIYCCSQEGKSYVLAPEPVGKVLAVNQLEEGCMATAAIAEGALFLRTKTALYRIQQK
jgi:outer membrane protein assembly factor BamB